MKVFILEDNPDRLSAFGALLGTVNIDTTADVLVALQHFERQEYDLIFLDHDLREEHYGADDCDRGSTGCGAARWLAQHPDLQKSARIIIHTQNQKCGERMAGFLRRRDNVEYIPWPELLKKLRDPNFAFS